MDDGRLTVGELFAGIGGFGLGLERAGMRTKWFCEIEPFPQRVLRKHWPDVPGYADIRELNAGNVERVDVLAGGFPCQDISTAGRGAGLEGARSALWFEYLRLIGELRPSYVVVENVDKLRGRGLDTVLAGLSSLGYDAEWDIVRASDVGAPHRRARLWLVGYPAGRSDGRRVFGEPWSWTEVVGVADPGGVGGAADGEPGDVARAAHRQEDSPDGRAVDDRRPAGRGLGAGDVPDADGEGEHAQPVDAGRARGLVPEPGVGGVRLAEPGLGRGFDGIPSWLDGSWERGVPRTSQGTPNRVHRLRALGNALVPVIAEEIGRRIVRWESTH